LSPESMIDYGSATGSELRDLLAPVTPEQFLDEYWLRRPLFVKGTPDKFGDLFGRAAFDRAIRRGCERTDLASFQLNVIRPRRDGDTVTHMQRIAPEDVDGKLAEGLTICVNDISVGDERLRFLARTVREQMSFLGEVWFNCYMSPPGSGANTHFDCTVTTSLQIEGRKRWRFSPAPAIDLPPSNAQARQDGQPVWMLPWFGYEEWDRLEKVDESKFTEVVLEPGDLLYLPAGTWHNAKAVEFSMALNMVFSPMNFFTLLMRLIEPAFQANPGWRGNPPPVYDVAREGQVPPQVESYLRDRFSELREFIGALDPAGAHVYEIWRTLAGH
jgi:ribosomal protein L16 Arg81 hydroxylase